MKLDEFQDSVTEGEEWICIGASGQEIKVKVEEKHDDWAQCTILSEPNKGNEHNYPATQFEKPA